MKIKIHPINQKATFKENEHLKHPGNRRPYELRLLPDNVLEMISLFLQGNNSKGETQI